VKLTILLHLVSRLKLGEPITYLFSLTGFHGAVPKRRNNLIHLPPLGPTDSPIEESKGAALRISSQLLEKILNQQHPHPILIMYLPQLYLNFPFSTF
jgi:hypothetical protein